MKLTGTAERIAERAFSVAKRQYDLTHPGHIPLDDSPRSNIRLLLSALALAVAEELDGRHESQVDSLAEQAIAKINHHFESRRRAAGG